MNAASVTLLGLGDKCVWALRVAEAAASAADAAATAAVAVAPSSVPFVHLALAFSLSMVFDERHHAVFRSRDIRRSALRILSCIT